MLATLEHHGLVEREPVTQRYALGYAAAQLAPRRLRAPCSSARAADARPLLRVDGRAGDARSRRALRLVYADQVDPPGAIAPDWPAARSRSHATSAGKAYLAWPSEAERDALLPAPLERYTPATITDRARLEAELEEIRRDGYGVCVGETEEFSNGASAVVLDRHAQPVAVVNVWGPSQRVTCRRLPRSAARRWPPRRRSAPR